MWCICLHVHTYQGGNGLDRKLFPSLSLEGRQFCAVSNPVACKPLMLFGLRTGPLLMFPNVLEHGMYKDAESSLSSPHCQLS